MALLNDYNVEKIPDSMTDEEAALVEPTAVVVYACDRGRVTAGSAVLGRRPHRHPCAADRAGVRRDADLRLGHQRHPAGARRQVVPGVVTINPARDDVGATVRDGHAGRAWLRRGAGMRGQRPALQSCLTRCASRRDRADRADGRQGSVDFFQLTFKDAEIRGSWCYPTHSWPRTIELIASGAIPALIWSVSLDDARPRVRGAAGPRRHATEDPDRPVALIAGTPFPARICPGATKPCYRCAGRWRSQCGAGRNRDACP